MTAPSLSQRLDPEAQQGMRAVTGELDVGRRLAGRGVRFFQLYHRGWDHHGGIKNGVQVTAKFIDQAAAAVQRGAGAVVGEVPRDHGLGARICGRAQEVPARTGQHRHPLQRTRGISGHAQGRIVECLRHLLGETRERAARGDAPDPSQQARVPAPVVDIEGGLLIGVGRHQRLQDRGLARARRHELKSQLGLAVERSGRARHGLRARAGEERADALAAVGAVGVVANRTGACAHHGVEYVICGCGRHEGHNLERVRTEERRESLHVFEPERIRQRVGGATGGDIEVGVHHSQRDACLQQTQGATWRVASGHETRCGLEEQRMVADQEVHRLGLEHPHRLLGDLMAERRARGARRRIPELKANGVPAPGLLPGRTLPQRSQHVRDGWRGPHTRDDTA
ncbi:MAG: DUF1501 domain-containing protein [Myxococcales bacterium]|nr:DUF1501 domain-containing protein [Myxococcales bacterium]